MCPRGGAHRFRRSGRRPAPSAGESVPEVASVLDEPWLDASVRIEDHPATGDVARRHLHPPEGGLCAFPQGYLAPKARAGNDPEHDRSGDRRNRCRGCRSVDRRGVVPSPALRPKGEERIRRHAGRTQRGQRVSTTSTSGGCASKYATKGGLSLSRANATPRAAPPRTNDSPESGRSRAWPGTPGQPAMTAERAPLPARMTRGDRPGRPALPPRRGGRPDGGAPGSRCALPYGPATAPSGLARGLRSNCPPRLEAPCVRNRSAVGVSRTENGVAGARTRAAEKGIGARTEVGGALHPHRGRGLRIAVQGVVAQAIYDCPGGDGGVPHGGERSLDGGLFGPVSLV